jgi:hypothetical protein
MSNIIDMGTGDEIEVDEPLDIDIMERAARRATGLELTARTHIIRLCGEVRRLRASNDDAADLINDLAESAKPSECPHCGTFVSAPPRRDEDGHDSDCLVARAIAWCVDRDGMWVLTPELEAELERRIREHAPRGAVPREAIASMIDDGLIRNENPALRTLGAWTDAGKYNWGVSIDMGWMVT